MGSDKFCESQTRESDGGGRLARAPEQAMIRLEAEGRIGIY